MAAAMGAALGVMASRFSEGSEETAKQLDRIQSEFLVLADADSAAYESVSDARKLPKSTAEEKAARAAAIQRALAGAAMPPLRGMQLAVEALEKLSAAAPGLNPHLSSDVGSAALLLEAGLQGCALNVRANAEILKDRTEAERLEGESARLAAAARTLRDQILSRKSPKE